MKQIRVVKDIGLLSQLLQNLKCDFLRAQIYIIHSVLRQRPGKLNQGLKKLWIKTLLHFPCFNLNQSLQKYEICIQILLAMSTEISRIITLVYLHIFGVISLVLRSFSVMVDQNLESLCKKVEMSASLLEVGILSLVQSFEFLQ